MEPAAELADDGFALDEAFARALARARAGVDHDDPFVAEFCAGNGAAVGESFRLPALARTLRRIGADGPSVFYEGRLARSIVDTVSRLGGLLAAADLGEHSAEFEPPITVRYGSAEVSVTLPVSMGWVLLQMLLLYERLDGRRIDDEADRIDLMVRCKHAAFADLARMPRWQETADVASVLGEGSLDRPLSRRRRHRGAQPIGSSSVGWNLAAISV